MTARPQRGRLRLVESEQTPAPEGAEVIGPASAEVEVRSPSKPPAVVTEHVAGGGLKELPDAQLVALGCKGDTVALGILYRRHAPFAINLAARIEGSSRDIEDIVHDAFLRAFERLNDLSDRAAFRSWLGAIVVHA